MDTKVFLFLTQMWSCIKVKVIQTDFKVYSLVLTIIILSFKEIGPYMSEYKPTWKLFVF